MSKIDDYIIELVRMSPLSWTSQTEHDRENLCEFVKSFALDVLHDKNLQKDLLEEIE